MCLQVRGQYSSLFDENRNLKKDESVLLASLKTREEKIKELKEKIVELEENREDTSKEILIVPMQSKHIETLDKAIQTQSIDAHVSNYICMY